VYRFSEVCVKLVSVQNSLLILLLKVVNQLVRSVATTGDREENATYSKSRNRSRVANLRLLRRRQATPTLPVQPIVRCGDPRPLTPNDWIEGSGPTLGLNQGRVGVALVQTESGELVVGSNRNLRGRGSRTVRLM
jgi:hypothetical protein